MATSGRPSHRLNDLARAGAPQALPGRVGSHPEGVLAGQAQVIGADIANILNVITTHEKVIPAIIVVIKKPTGKAVARFGHAGLLGDVGELPDRLARRVNPRRTVIAKQNLGAAQDRKKKVGATVVVKISAADPLDETNKAKPRLDAAFRESPIAIVVIELTTIRACADRFVADEQIYPTIVVIIEPHRGLGGLEGE